MMKLSKNILLYLLTFSLGWYMSFVPSAQAEGARTLQAAFSQTSDAPAQFSSSNLTDQDKLPPAYPAEEEENLEELIEDASESADDLSALPSGITTRIAHLNWSNNYSHESTSVFHAGKTPIYILFHCWKSFLV